VVLANHQTIAHAMLDTLVINASSMFALEFHLLIQMFALVMEIAQIQNFVSVMLVSMETIVKIPFFGISLEKSTLLDQL
jgi:hypothetical protein